MDLHLQGTHLHWCHFTPLISLDPPNWLYYEDRECVKHIIVTDETFLLVVSTNSQPSVAAR
jgi:hypothetical protein